MENIKVSKKVFQSAKQEATWSGTVECLNQNFVYPLLLQGENVDGNKSYHDEKECVIVGAITGRVTRIVIA